METNSNLSVNNLILFASISSSILSMSYDSETLIPQKEANYNYEHSLVDWKDDAFNHTYNYSFQDVNNVKIKSIIELSKKLMDKSHDIDNEFVDIVNEKFWDLI